MIRILIADDSALMRRTLRRIIEADPELELIAHARDGQDAVEKARELRPDVITMDINMPVMDGVTALQHIVHEDICPVIMLSSLTHKGAMITFEALELGAFDYVGKPDGTVSDLENVVDELIKKIKAAATSRKFASIRKQRISQRESRPARPAKTTRQKVAPGHDFKAIAIGISTGGPATIMDVIPYFPIDINAAVFLVQHMPANFIQSFVQRLNKESLLTVVEAESGMTVEPGVCYVAPGDRQLTLYKKLTKKIVIRTPDSPITTFMPSADVMMDSVYEAFGKDTIGVLMTGIGGDGAQAMVNIKEGGGYTVGESEESCIVYGMPRTAYEYGGTCDMLPSWDIAKAVLRRV